MFTPILLLLRLLKYLTKTYTNVNIAISSELRGTLDSDQDLWIVSQKIMKDVIISNSRMLI